MAQSLQSHIHCTAGCGVHDWTGVVSVQISRRAFGTTIQSVNETLENGLPSPEHEEAYEDLDPRSRAAYLRWLVKQPAYEEPIVAASELT